ncbi:MAG: aspartate-semialdehyde dehydrogenase [Candidatus Borkfalkiaceae bacterium]|nr:aspartate-semialdehyde dehydrogenase [Eubacteriales bacterium]MDY5819835.1 aspartate-semialdehyde dehydrogenase [Christensenellaceae bacterium]
MNDKYAVGVVGATGLIGGKFIKVLENRKFPVGEFRPFASAKNAGKTIFAFNENLKLRLLRDGCFDGLDFVFFCAGRDVSLRYAPAAAAAGAIVVDNSSAFRREKDIPLVVPEINFGEITSADRLISNPNCSTIQAVLPLSVIRENFGIERIIYTTYQAVSGSGRKGVADLRLTGYGFSPSFYPLPISRTCIPEIGDFTPDGYTEEEKKMEFETNKILGVSVPVSATCVRVPIENCHAVAIEVEVKKPIDLSEVKAKLAAKRGIVLSDLPSAVEADGSYDVFVGRIRKSTAYENGLSFITCADNTLRGAAYNAVRIAEKIIEGKNEPKNPKNAVKYS